MRVGFRQYLEPIGTFSLRTGIKHLKIINYKKKKKSVKTKKNNNNNENKLKCIQMEN